MKWKYKHVLFNISVVKGLCLIVTATRLLSAVVKLCWVTDQTPTVADFAASQ